MARWVVLVLIMVVGVSVGARTQSDSAGPPLPDCPERPPIVIDAGHGGIDGGANVPGMLEKDIVLDTALRLEQHLVAYNLPVVMTRRTDTDLGGRNDGWRLRRDINYRVRVANQCKAAFVLSLHVNAAGPREHGMMVFYQPTRPSRDAAYLMHRALLDSGLNQRKERPIPRTDFAVFKYTHSPAVLLELGFVSSAADRAKLGDEAYREHVSQMLALSLVTIYQNWMNDGSG